MPNPIYEQIPIRLQLDLISNPPVAPIDANTGLAPRLWRANTISMQIGIFDANGIGVDLQNLDYLQVILQKASDSLVPITTKQINAVDITDVITVGGWKDGSAQNAIALFTAAETDQGLEAGESAAFWLIVRGVTNDGAPLLYGAGPVTIYNPGSTLPTPTRGVTSRHAQESDAGNATVMPTSPFHKEIITVGGAARTSNILLGIAGIEDGAELTLIVNLPATADITLNVRNALVGNAIISTLTTGSVLQALLKYYFNADLVAWVPMLYMLPPT